MVIRTAAQLAVIPLLLATFLPARAQDAAGTVFWVDDLDVSLSRCGWQRTLARQSVGGNPFRLAGQEYARGIGTHPPGGFWIELGGHGLRFHAVCGVDDEMGNDGSVEFRVLGDGKPLWSAVLRGPDPSVTVDVDLRGVRVLCLEVGTTPDGYGCDHADWCDAWIEMSEGSPKAISEPPPTPFEDLEREITFFRNQGANSRFITQAYRPEATIYPTDRDALDVILRRTRALLEHLRSMPRGPVLADESRELESLEGLADGVGPDDREGRPLVFAQVDDLRRRIAFRNPLLDFSRLLFLKRFFMPGIYSAGDHMCDQYFGFHALPGGGLFVLEDPFGPSPRVVDLLAGVTCENGRLAGSSLAGGGFLSPDLSFDAREVLFAWTEGRQTPYQWTEDSTYHLFRLTLDGLVLRQLTDGPVNDFDPCWLPNGRVAFISERRGGFGRCHGRPVPTYTLHTMAADGSDILCISPHETNEWQPSVAADGLLLYTRWDYVDRGFNQAHHPWVITPDGCDPRVVQGNYGLALDRRPQMEMDLRAIPGSRRLVATAAAHHSQAYGPLVVIDPALPDDDGMGPVRRLTPAAMFPEAECASTDSQQCASPWPLDETFFLCVYDPLGAGIRGAANRHGIYLLDAFGNRILLYRDPEIGCLSPIPLKPRPMPPIVPERTTRGIRPEEFRVGGSSLSPATGKVGLVNVYDSTLPFPEGTRIRALRVIEVLPKVTPSADDPPIGYGSQKSARRVLGTVPVEEDGSAWFTLPAGRPVFFQALDADGLAIQSMRSETWVQPGETLTCQGCHNPPDHAPANRSPGPLAFGRPPSVLRPESEGSSPFSFARLVQPVLDRACVECHAKSPGALDLGRGDFEHADHYWYASYRNLRDYAFFFAQADWTTPRTEPGRFGARASRLYQLLAQGHHGVSLAPEDLHRITLWLDCNSDFFGAYTRTLEQAQGAVVEPELE
ncbi:MAG: hypothetical protein FJX75_07405 [Armatimonadetes bacterium]|nr:hypothetical protein [Armatimonadota bacterium]